jgi:AcrR family transcriptional regulator
VAVLPSAGDAPRRRGRPTAGTGEDTLRQVLDVARRQFAEYGYAGATMRSIAGAAGVTPMALYNYAPSKAALFALAWKDSIVQIYTDYEEVVAGRASLFEEVEALVDRSRQVLVDHPEHIRLVLRVLLDHEHPDLAGADLQPATATDFFEHLADRGVQRGEITVPDREQLISFLVTLLWGITTLTAFDPAALDPAIDAAKWAVRQQLRDPETGTVRG